MGRIWRRASLAAARGSSTKCGSAPITAGVPHQVRECPSATVQAVLSQMRDCPPCNCGTTLQIHRINQRPERRSAPAAGADRSPWEPPRGRDSKPRTIVRRGCYGWEVPARRLTSDQKAELVRLGALALGRRFVGKFATRFEGGLGPRAAAEEAIVDLARDGLRAVIRFATPPAPIAERNRRPAARRLPAAAVSPRAGAEPRPSAKRRGPTAPTAATPDPLTRLKRSVVPDPTR